ncbi:MAG TPA: nucleotidyltransferase family protein [Urbifossiella sp.]
MSTPLDGISAAILAGGLGTRLRAVVADRPKVLAPVAGRPYLAYLLDQLVGAGIRETTLLVGYAADQVQATFGEHYRGMTLQYSVECEPLGTGGAIRMALPLLREKTILLLNGDSYCDVDVNALVEFHNHHGGRATLTLAQVEDASRYGRVQLLETQRIARFEEKSGAAEPGWINAGIYVLNRSDLEQIPPECAVSLEREILPGMVAAGNVFGFPGGRFIDIGTPQSYAEADAFFTPPPSARD